MGAGGMYNDVSASSAPELLITNRIPALDSTWSDSKALEVVKADFSYAEAYRTQAHDWRYRNANELYLAWTPQRYWEGTRVPRSSIGIYTVFEQVESMLPKIVAAITDPENYNFYPLYSNEYDHALAWKRLVLEQMDEIGWREHIRRCCKSSLIYGNGILEAGVEDYQSESIVFSESHHVSEMQFMEHPIMGTVPVPTRIDTTYNRKISKTRSVRPYLRYVSLLDCYMDPNNESTTCQAGSYFIKRNFLTAGKLKSLRGKGSFSIPDDATLARMSKTRTSANQDVTKSTIESYRYSMWNPALDYSADPSSRRIEVIEYTTPERKIWMLNREAIVYNQPNKYGKINYYSMHYADVLDRWHALAISDVAEGEQRLQGSIINARVDELALSIHRPMVKKRGVTLPAYQLKVRPGLVLESEDPNGDFKQMEVQNITQQAFVEVAASNNRVQQTTGVTDLASMGVPSAGGNAAARTATGVNTQASASQSRMIYYVENAESLTMEPLVNDIIDYDKKFLDMNVAATWLKNDPAFAKLDPLEVMNCEVKAECRASIKMAGRMGFLQILPILTQTVLNPAVLQLLAQQQRKTLSAETFERMVWDAINYTPRNPLIVDMTPQQVQQMMTPPPEVQAKAAMQQQQIQSDEQIHAGMNQTKFLTQFLKDAFRYAGITSQLDDQHIQFLATHALETAKAQNDAQHNEKQLEHDKETAKVKKHESSS